MASYQQSVSQLNAASTPLSGGEQVPLVQNGQLVRASVSAIQGNTTIPDGDKGDITVSSSGTIWTIDNQAVTYAKIQNISSTSRLLGRNTAGAGSAEEVTITQALDFVGGAVQGSVLYRGATAWTALSPGTSGYRLTTNGAGADPTWEASSGGSVTSVAASVPSFLSISGSPITTAGTLAISYSGLALPVANGGTGQTSYTDGQLLIGNTVGNTLTKATLTAGSGVSITNGNGSITIAATGGTGTVTSVDASVPSFLSISGNPITTSGTLAITYSGTALPVANGGTGITSFGTGVATWLGTPSSANLAAAMTDETGSGSLVFATSPTLVTPLLGTPTSGTLTNCTGLPISSGVSGLGTGVATFLATPSSANLAAALTDETGTGSAVFATSPTLVTPLLGTPTSGNLSNCTADGTNSVGFRTVPSNSQSAAYTTVLSDSGKSIDHPSTDANARTFTIDSNANVPYPVGTCITFTNMTSQVVTIAITSDTMYLAGTGTTGSRSLAQYGVATARKLTSTTWLISGTGLT